MFLLVLLLLLHCYRCCCCLLQTNTLERRLFYIPSFKIYGSVAGFYDYGPPGCAIKQNLTQVSKSIMKWDSGVLGGGQQQIHQQDGSA
jgi:hypothetical protein